MIPITTPSPCRAITFHEKISPFLPVVSTIVSLFELVTKATLQCIDTTELTSRYFFYIKEKNIWESVILLIPVLGNLIVCIYKAIKQAKQKKVEAFKKEEGKKAFTEAKELSPREEVERASITPEKNKIYIAALEKAADYDVPEALYKLAKIYKGEGYYEYPDPEKALSYLHRAAVLEYPLAIFELAIHYDKDPQYASLVLQAYDFLFKFKDSPLEETQKLQLRYLRAVKLFKGVRLPKQTAHEAELEARVVLGGLSRNAFKQDKDLSLEPYDLYAACVLTESNFKATEKELNEKIHRILDEAKRMRQEEEEKTTDLPVEVYERIIKTKNTNISNSALYRAELLLARHHFGNEDPEQQQKAIDAMRYLSARKSHAFPYNARAHLLLAQFCKERRDELPYLTKKNAKWHYDKCCSKLKQHAKESAQSASFKGDLEEKKRLDQMLEEIDETITPAFAKWTSDPDDADLDEQTPDADPSNQGDR